MYSGGELGKTPLGWLFSWPVLLFFLLGCGTLVGSIIWALVWIASHVQWVS